jgi:hypothetical protein
VEADGVGIRDGSDLDDALVDQALYPLAGGRFRQADGSGDGGIGAAAVLLQLLDDSLADHVEGAPRVPHGNTFVGPLIDTGKIARSGHENRFYSLTADSATDSFASEQKSARMSGEVRPGGRPRKGGRKHVRDPEELRQRRTGGREEREAQ